MKQHGYAILLSLLTLLGVGGVWLTGIAMQNMRYSADQTLALSEAKSALVSYAVNYIDHYGPQGAGIGHLPCPDTDLPSSADEDTWHRDGPNPPCAKKAIEHGWLPIHVTVRDGRYHFHTRSHQRLLYAVSGNFVNNPVGRIVNPSTHGEFNIDQHSDVIAVIATPPLDAEPASNSFWLNLEALATKGSAYTLIRAADIHTQSMQRVGAWLVGRLNGALATHCESRINTTACSLAELSFMQCATPNRYVLLQWLYAHLSPVDCDAHKQYLESGIVMLEDVPLQRHWFMRNEWFDFVELLFDENCFRDDALTCRFVLLPIADSIPMLKLRLQPTQRPTEK